MADGASAAVSKAREIVTLSDGSSVVIEEWAWAKIPSMIQLLGDWNKTPLLVEYSVRPEDRDKISKLQNKDLMKLAEAVYRLNVDEDLLKNSVSLASRIEKLGEGMAPPIPSTKPSESSAAPG